MRVQMPAHPARYGRRNRISRRPAIPAPALITAAEPGPKPAPARLHFRLTAIAPIPLPGRGYLSCPARAPCSGRLGRVFGLAEKDARAAAVTPGIELGIVLHRGEGGP